jgi:hypothetical protein
MKSPRALALFSIALLLWTVQSKGQETRLVGGTAGFSWPDTPASSAQSNALAKEKIEAFLNSLRARTPGYAPIRVGEFRFVLLEKGRYYLVATTGDRFYWNTDVVMTKGDRFQYTEFVSHGAFPLAMRAVDLDGDGIDELVTAEWPAGYLGASTPPIYWYTVWRFRDGLPEDASAKFPEFYRAFVLGELPYLDGLLSTLHTVDPEGVKLPLAEVECVRLKFRRVILGEKNAGLEQALAWAESKDTSLQNMSVWSLAEMPAPDAGKELNKLAGSPAIADLAKAALARRARLLGKE